MQPPAPVPPWPFPQWNGKRWVMPAELQRKQQQEQPPAPFEEAPF